MQPYLLTIDGKGFLLRQLKDARLSTNLLIITQRPRKERRFTTECKFLSQKVTVQGNFEICQRNKF